MFGIIIIIIGGGGGGRTALGAGAAAAAAMVVVRVAVGVVVVVVEIIPVHVDDFMEERQRVFMGTLGKKQRRDEKAKIASALGNTRGRGVPLFLQET